MVEKRTPINVIVVLRRTSRESDVEFIDRNEEMVGLCEAAGATVLSEIVQIRDTRHPAFYLGTGKVSELADAVSDLGVELVIFDEELSPAQVRNLEYKLDCRVIDRTQLILDIFALRAGSRAGRLQVEMAQLQYLLPRLSGRGTAMSRLGGGIGTRGPGETQLEVDRRRIRKRIDHLRQALRKLEQTRSVQRQRRISRVPVVALVGYTNAGKSTLMSRWLFSKEKTAEERGHDRLFDTLDPAARRVSAGIAGEIVLLDTVGFVRRLPHELVNAFRSTLEEVANADVIVHVVDGSRDSRALMETTYQVLEEVGASTAPIITFFNKLEDNLVRPMPDPKANKSIYGAALTGEGLPDLIQSVEKLVGLDPIDVVIDGKQDSEQFWRTVSRGAEIVNTEVTDEGRVVCHLRVDRRDRQMFLNDAESSIS